MHFKKMQNFKKYRCMCGQGLSLYAQQWTSVDFGSYFRFSLISLTMNLVMFIPHRFSLVLVDNTFTR